MRVCRHTFAMQQSAYVFEPLPYAQSDMLSAMSAWISKLDAASRMKLDKMTSEELGHLKPIILGSWGGSRMAIIEALESACIQSSSSSQLPKCATNWQLWKTAVMEEGEERRALSKTKKVKRKRGQW